MVVLYIVLFIVCLSTLIMVHEAGHLITAKAFNVYCFEYAIGFGPKLFSRKRKNGQTYFSIRAIPFGGFVSMYGESETIPEGLEVDPSRSLLAIKKWKRAIIMAAGVIMNFILALLVFFIYEVAFPSYQGRYGHITVSNDSLAYSAGLRSQDSVYATVLTYEDSAFIFYDDDSVFEYTDSSAVAAFVGFDYNTLSLKDTSLINHAVAFERLEFGSYVVSTYPSVAIADILAGDYSGEAVVNNEIKGYVGAFYSKKNGEVYSVEIALVDNIHAKDVTPVIAELSLTEEQYKTMSFVPLNNEIVVAGDIYEKTVDGKVYKYVKVNGLDFKTDYPSVLGNNLFNHKYSGLEPTKLSMSLYVYDETNPTSRGVSHDLDNMTLTKSGDNYRLPDNIGISMQLDTYRNGFGESIKNTFVDFGNSATAIVRGLGHLFTSSEGWRDVGGIIAIGVQTTKILQENGFGTFLFYWGLISVNLGIVNLLPFPGLDGWHLLVLAVEGITRKEIPSKVKNIVSAVGVAILLVLMVLIIIKDIIGLF